MSNGKKFDLEERTAIFSENIIDFCRSIPKDLITSPILSQLIRACTSIGANYCEADCAESKKDFIHKIGICKKESRESKYWLRTIARAVPDKSEFARVLWKEAGELNLIFIAIVEKTKNNGK